MSVLRVSTAIALFQVVASTAEAAVVIVATPYACLMSGFFPVHKDEAHTLQPQTKYSVS